MLEERIRYLAKILKDTTIEDIEKIYRIKEVAFLENHLAKYHEVRYSENMLKKMKKEAGSKRLTKSQKKYISELIIKTTKFISKEIMPFVLDETDLLFDELYEGLENHSEARLIHIEHDSSPSEMVVQVYNGSLEDKYDNEVLCFTIYYNFEELWGFENDRKYSALCEKLGDVSIKDEEYMLMFSELMKLRSYKLVKMALNRKANKEYIINGLCFSNMYIEIGEHDNWTYKIFEC